MTKQHPITPPPELVYDWMAQLDDLSCQIVFSEIAQWGADQELEACCEWFQEFYKTESWVKHDLKHFRAARRPKPPSLKQQALDQLSHVEDRYGVINTDYIRRALEQLDD